MAMFAKKSPDSYPATFHTAFILAERRLLADLRTVTVVEEVHLRIDREAREKKGKSFAQLIEIERRRMGAFKKNIRLHPLHRFNNVLDMAEVRVSPRRFQDGWGLCLTFTRLSGVVGSFQAALSK